MVIPDRMSLLFNYFVIPSLLSQSDKELLLDIKFYYCKLLTNRKTIRNYDQNKFRKLMKKLISYLFFDHLLL
jgi:hypothetical protein